MDMNPNTVAKITVELQDNGQVKIQSSTQDKVLNMGLLEAAKFALALQKSSIVTPAIIPPPNVLKQS